MLVCLALALLLLAGCVPIGIRTSNMYAEAALAAP
jgi:hypothetical protein